MTRPSEEPHDRPRLLGPRVTRILITAKTELGSPPQADSCRAGGGEPWAEGCGWRAVGGELCVEGEGAEGAVAKALQTREAGETEKRVGAVPRNSAAPDEAGYTYF